ncbi:Uncharacterised protein [Sphingobacterium daejeonense]|nr:Uncharacterised protein [Sphingobacterium daejeonense]
MVLAKLALPLINVGIGTFIITACLFVDTFPDAFDCFKTGC